MTIKRMESFSGTKEDHRKEFPDTNFNNLVRMEIKIDGKLFSVTEKTVNTQNDWYEFQTSLMERIEAMKLVAIARFKFKPPILLKLLFTTDIE